MVRKKLKASGFLRSSVNQLGMVLVIVIIGCLALFSIRYFNKISVCSQLKPGITLADMVERLGPPSSAKSSETGQWVFFESTIGAAGPIRAKVDDHDRIVVLRCNEDGPPTWSLE